MGKKILFSPVGGTDPINKKNYTEGSLLQICRKFEPDIIYLYMSKEILEYHNNDNRYCKAIRYLYEEKGLSFDEKSMIKIIDRGDLENVQKFDPYYEDFSKILGKIKLKMEEEDELILNVSSGTPAMKSALLVINTLGETEYNCIQVTTPVNQMNTKKDNDEFDIEYAWEKNVDKGKESSRCEIVKSDNLLFMKQKEILKELISGYDYSAAHKFSKNMKNRSKYIKYIDVGFKRLQLDFDGVRKILDEKELKEFFPVLKERDLEIFEYVINLEIKLRKKEYADFIRAISPVLVDLLELVIKKELKININKYTKPKSNYSKMIVWDRNKLYNTELDNIFKDSFNNFNYSFIKFNDLKLIIDKKSDNKELKEIIERLRSVEEKVRNIASHEIISITEKSLKSMCFYSGEQIISDIKALFSYTNIKIKEEYWGSYDHMNNKLIKMVDES